MTLYFSDGFDSYTTSAQMANRWVGYTNLTLQTGGAGRFGGNGVVVSNASSSLAAMYGSPSIPLGNKVRAGFYFKVNNSGSANNYPIFTLDSGASTSFAAVYVSAPSGRVSTNKLGSSTGTPLATGTANVCDGQYHWIEVEWLLATGATGSSTIYVDGVLDATVTGIATVVSSTYYPIVAARLNGTFVASAPIFDDFIFWDDQGTTFNTFPLGPRRIVSLSPAGDSTPSQFTPNSGTTHYTQVNGGWSSANYVQDGGTGNADMYTFGALPFTPTTINAVVQLILAQNPGTASASLIPKLKTGATTSNGATLTLGSGGVNKVSTTVWGVDATGAAWTAANVNAMIAGVGD
ncbi:hypothetical protein [Cupriavidus sp. BIC8F]|uniref:hypothetical protein n=1 Tax=Cupriavidus sp. BIC8F TaxID=3079014 RepID=UPI0029165994|nr:hypothetical protein [Cupriavidus sp. BIC8F]